MKKETLSEKIKQIIKNMKTKLSDLGSAMVSDGKRNGRNKKRNGSGN